MRLQHNSALLPLHLQQQELQLHALPQAFHVKVLETKNNREE
jgi:hypothetical protein